MIVVDILSVCLHKLVIALVFFGIPASDIDFVKIVPV
jgi:hypothetical protein